MKTPQTLANDLGATLRAAETALNVDNDVAAAVAALEEQHNHLGQAFHVFNDLAAQHGFDPIDWAAAAGTTGTKGAQTRGGGPKTPPPQED